LALRRPRLGLPRFRVPNTRTGALLVAGGLTIAGFGLGLLVLIVLPAFSSGNGLFALLRRGGPPLVLDARVGLPPQPTTTSRRERPELWLTPVANLAFPSLVPPDGRSRGAATVTYVPDRSPKVLTLPPINDFLGRPAISAVVSFASEDEPATPGPYRPDPAEPTQVTVAAVTTDAGPAMSGCVLALRGDRLQATAAFGLARTDECQTGKLRLTENAVLDFSITFDLLPNFRSRDGAWRAGGVFGRTSITVNAGSGG
jgi:hypothetical protein